MGFPHGIPSKVRILLYNNGERLSIANRVDYPTIFDFARDFVENVPKTVWRFTRKTYKALCDARSVTFANDRLEHASARSFREVNNLIGLLRRP